MMLRLHWLIATFMGVGWMPFAPGTWGTLAGLLVAGFVAPWAMLLTALVGWWSTHGILAVEKNRDPQAIVIDEVTGIWLALLVCGRPLLWPDALGIFLVFRVLDIIKPFPIGWIDQRLAKSPRWASLGVMLDDWIAGLIAGLVWRAF